MAQGTHSAYPLADISSPLADTLIVPGGLQHPAPAEITDKGGARLGVSELSSPRATSVTIEVTEVRHWSSRQLDGHRPVGE